MTERRRHRARRPAALYVLVAIVGLATMVALDLLLTWTLHAPRIAALAATVPSETSYMRLAVQQGHPIREREWTPLVATGPLAACSVLESEDADFFNIGTLNYRSQRQMIQRVLHGDFSKGGSGIAQQLARNLFLGPQRSVRRKVREYLLAWQLTHALTKDRQLELYLNVVEWGDGVWGIGAASRHWFGVPPSELKPTQAVVLATMLPAPRRGLTRGVSAQTATKQIAVLRRLAGTGLIDDLTRDATSDRLALWRALLRSGLSFPDAVAGTDRIMGPEPAAHPLAGIGQRPLGEACQSKRRPN